MLDWINTYIGKKIYEYRKEKGMSQEALGENLGLSRTSIANYESGTQSLSIADLYKIAIIFKKDILDFLPPIVEVMNLLKTPEEKISEDASISNAIKEELTSVVRKIKKETE